MNGILFFILINNITKRFQTTPRAFVLYIVQHRVRCQEDLSTSEAPTETID